MNRLFIVAIILFPICLYGQTYTTPIRVNLDKSLRADRAPMMKLDRNGNIYIAWVSGAASNGSGSISIAVSTDGGMTFNNNLVSSDADCNSNFQRGPQFVIDTKGTIHLVWMGGRVNMQPDVWYTRSSDQGKTWSKPITIDDAGDSSKYAQDFPSIACDSSDNIYVSFLDMRMTQQKLATTPFLYFSRSTDGGMTWSVNTRADVPPNGMGGTCECCAETIASTRDGHIYIVYRSNINNVRDIWLARSYDKGMTFQPALKIMTSDWNIQACPVTGPRIALDDSEGAHIVWRDARDDSGMAHLYYAYVPKGSEQTPANTAFDATGAQSANYADIAFYNQGNYKVIAYQTFNYGMRYILSNDNTILVSNRPLQANGNSNKSFANVLFAADGTRYLAWQDDITDEGDIYFMKETSSLRMAGINYKHGQSDLIIYPNPLLQNQRTFEFEGMENSAATIRVTDMLGKEVYKIFVSASAQKKITVPNLIPGSYYIRIESSGSIISKMIIVQ
jgi:hypothetical protein